MRDVSLARRFLVPSPPLVLVRLNRRDQPVHIRNGPHATAALCGLALAADAYAVDSVLRSGVCLWCLASKQWKESEKLR